MDVKVCEYILEIARQKSITKAAEVLDISQSALSQCLIRVEKDMGASLFTRRKTALVPTEAGKLYVEAAARMVETKRSLQAEIASMAGKKRIFIGISSMWGMELMMDIIPVFRNRYPDVTLELDNGNFANLSSAYMQGKYDFLITSSPSEDALPGMAVPLRREELKLIIGIEHEFAKRHKDEKILPRTIIRDELEHEDVIRHERGATNHDIENELFHELDIQTRTICRLGNYSALVHLVGGGMGYAIVSGDVLDKGKDIASWSLSPKLERLNMMFVHPNVAVEAPEKYLMELIRGHRLFKK